MGGNQARLSKEQAQEYAWVSNATDSDYERVMGLAEALKMGNHPTTPTLPAVSGALQPVLRTSTSWPPSPSSRSGRVCLAGVWWPSTLLVDLTVPQRGPPLSAPAGPARENGPKSKSQPSCDERKR